MPMTQEEKETLKQSVDNILFALTDTYTSQLLLGYTTKLKINIDGDQPFITALSDFCSEVSSCIGDVIINK